jgi:hypothetical protein
VIDDLSKRFVPLRGHDEFRIDGAELMRRALGDELFDESQHLVGGHVVHADAKDVE